jgi:tetratricopeptide (TPR) repeat protein
MRIQIVRAFAAGSAALLLAGCQSDEQKISQHLARGQEYLDGEKWAEAVIEYKNVLQIDPNQPEAHWKLSQAFLRSEKPREGFWELRETVRLDPKNNDAKLQFAQLSIYAGELEEALTRADEVIAADPKRSDAYLVKAQAHEALKQIDEARAAYARAVELAPEVYPPKLLFASFLRRHDQRADAEVQFNEAIRVKASPETYMALAGFLAETSDRDDEAEAAYKKALELAEGDTLVGAYSVLGSFYYVRDRFPEAVSTLEKGIEASGNSVDLIYLLARMYREKGDQAKADLLAQRATEVKPDDYHTHLVLSAYRDQIGDLDGALEAARNGAKVAPKGTDEADLRVAEVLLEIGFTRNEPEKVKEGREITERVLAERPTSAGALFVMAKLDIAEKRFDDAIRGLRTVIDQRPDWAKAHFLLGSALALSGERTAARSELARSLEIDPTLIEARRLLADVHAALGEHEYAVEEARRFLKERPDSLPVRLRVAQSLVNLDRVDEALAEIEAVEESKRNAEVNYAIARIYLRKGRLDSARKYFEKALSQAPRNPEILDSLLTIDSSEGRTDESAQRIKAALAEEPNSAPLQQLAGRLAALQGRNDDAEAAFKRALELDPNLMSSYRMLAQFYARTGRTGETIGTYEKALAVKEDQPQIHHFLGVLYEYGGERDRAVQHYESAIRYEPNLGEAKNNLAYLFAEKGENLDRALDLAQEAKALMPDDPNTADTLGWVLYRRGVPSAAIGYLKEAASGTRPGEANLGLIRYHLALAYEASGDKAGAKEAAQQALADHQAYAASQKAAGAAAVADPPWMADARGILQRTSTQ